MRYVIASDIHGKILYLRFLMEKIGELNADKVILLGDLYDYGAVGSVNALLRAVSVPLIGVEGNCDRQFGEENIFDNAPSFIKEPLSLRTAYLSHGDWYNSYRLPQGMKSGDIFIYGHNHVPSLTHQNGIFIANTGSVGLPRQNSPRSFIEMTENELVIRELEFGEILKRENLC